MADPKWWPVDTVDITAEFGADAAWYQANVGQLGHNGIDIKGAHRTPIYAIDDGVILLEGWNTSWSGVAGGISVVIRHGWGHSGYAHLDETVINAGQSVARGQLIGYMGATGLVTGTHLHFETMPLSVNWGNGYSGRVNPRQFITLAARGSTTGSTPPTISGGLPMFALYWTGPAVNNTKVSGRIVTGYGSFHVPNMQIMTLLNRRHDAALKPGDSTDNMLDAEHDIINSFLRACFQSALTGVQLDAERFLKAINEGFAKLGKSITVTADSVDIDPADLLAALELAVPRIAEAMVKQAGKKLSA
ncbi:M23 family metallopeptidase [Leucobacter sp. Z1108]|uniref:M23 family metallopeptidase n=1 Tax=Leucobacter sp. Z1108 TaxID=3439066 RepID=UPI003F354FD1